MLNAQARSFDSECDAGIVQAIDLDLSELAARKGPGGTESDFDGRAEIQFGSSCVCWFGRKAQKSHQPAEMPASSLQTSLLTRT